MNLQSQSVKTAGMRALTVTELLVTIGCIALLVVILLPALAKSQAHSKRLGCANCLKQISLGAKTWSLDNNDLFPMRVSLTSGGSLELRSNGAVYPHFQVMSNELSTPRILLCPNDTKRSYSTSFVDLTDKNVSYFLNLDAKNNDESNLLAGDRNITNRAHPSNPLVPLTREDSIAWTKEIHRQQGYLGFGDGRVDLYANANVGAVIKLMSGGTNWLALP